ncbi:MAG: TfoX/Sxy family protein [Flavobacteriales bacterium]|nr:TfoX/Sxy family protein [Flavobacteriales bacterium]
MAYDEELAYRIREHLKLWDLPVDERKMFGGVCFMHKNKMAIGVGREELMVRVVEEKMEGVLAEEHVRPMDFTGKPMKEFIFVHPDGAETEEQLGKWIEMGNEHAERKAGS